MFPVDIYLNFISGDLRCKISQISQMHKGFTYTCTALKYGTHSRRIHTVLLTILAHYGTTEKSAFDQYFVVFLIVIPTMYIACHYKHRLIPKPFCTLKMTYGVNKWSYDGK